VRRLASGVRKRATPSIDLALRFADPGGGPPAEATSHVEIQSKRFASFPAGVYASRDYIARAGRPQTAHALRGHDIVLPNEDAEAVDARELWILMPSDLVRVARVRVIWDFIVDLTMKQNEKCALGAPSVRPRSARRHQTS
jgi:hypothetical protein